MGRGHQLVRNPGELVEVGSESVMQKYLENPLLVNSYKFNVLCRAVLCALLCRAVPCCAIACAVPCLALPYPAVARAVPCRAIWH